MNIILAMLTAALWGTTYGVTQYTLPDWPPLLLGAIRALPAGIILWCFRPRFPVREHGLALLKLGAVNIALFFSLIFVMAHTLPSAISGVGMVSVPLFAMIFQFVVLKHKPSGAQILAGVLLLVLGLMLFNPASLSLNPVGLVAMFAAISCIILGSRMTQTLSGRMHWWDVLVWQLILGGALLALIGSGQWLIAPGGFAAVADGISGREFAGIAWIVLFNTVLAYGLYVFLMQRMSIVDFTFGGIANPITGIALGVLLMGEQYSHTQYMLMAGMIVSSLLPSLWQRFKRPAN
ncbi:DMT family transporter [Shewanella amazonensis]|uniref:Permease of the drug/metabolite transporter (DMT) superfamily n=1 Tax=Shewanella amazonensis (strain ATCC BAA-1098 / SB2B) TaxID=326297 RepID=A1SBL1_SHEAM|nr:EamA family transporter [Shewanella amazonensis]ABM01768.1 permease of the drug/metabolite transporter (DMT) superfamily [Shewanella amazonensis SB2B]